MPEDISEAGRAISAANAAKLKAAAQAIIDIIDGANNGPATTTSDAEPAESAVSERDMQQLAGGKVDLDKLDTSDFVFPETRTFPVVTPPDVTAAVHSWGRYKGSETFDTFKANLTALAKRKGEPFAARLPAEWTQPKKESRFEPTPLDFAILTEVLGDHGHIVEAGNEQALIDSFGKWANGSEATCASVLAGKGFSDVNALCSWLKDRYTGSTHWRGKGKESATEADKPTFKTIPVGTKVHWTYRSATGTGYITGVHKLGTTADNTEYSIRQTDDHVSATGSKEPTIVYHYGSNIRVASEAAASFTGDLVPLEEKAVAKDGTANICLITPGWGSSGHYSADMLKRDGPKVFTSGTAMYIDHPTETEAIERPERSVRDMGGVLTEDAKWLDDGPNGPGLYAKASILPPLSGVLDALAPHIGVSIRASGEAQEGEADGKRGRIINRLVNAASVDFVTKAGRGGKVLPLMESIRNGQSIELKEDDVDLTEAQNEIASLKEALAKQNEAATAQATELARLRERALVADATALVTAQLREARLPDVTKTRLAAQLTSNPPVKEHELDREALAETVKAAVEAETAYLASIMPSGRIQGLGSVQTAEVSEADTEKALMQLYQSQGYSEAAARQMAAS